IWEETRAKKLFGKLQHKSFEDQFPEAGSLGEKPSPDVMSHQKFQADIQNMRNYIEYLKEGLRDHVGKEAKTGPAFTGANPKVSLARGERPIESAQPQEPSSGQIRRGKISLAKQVPRSSDISSAPPPEHSSLSPNSKISLAKKKPPIGGAK
ncbi:MAG: hypothetical protein Q7S48_01130, partial [bacterium]|nr:hypothetical protein [bacterium]